MTEQCTADVLIEIAQKYSNKVMKYEEIIDGLVNKGKIPEADIAVLTSTVYSVAAGVLSLGGGILKAISNPDLNPDPSYEVYASLYDLHDFANTVDDTSNYSGSEKGGGGGFTWMDTIYRFENPKKLNEYLLANAPKGKVSIILNKNPEILMFRDSFLTNLHPDSFIATHSIRSALYQRLKDAKSRWPNPSSASIPVTELMHAIAPQEVLDLTKIPEETDLRPKISVIDKGEWEGSTYTGLHFRVDDTLGTKLIDNKIELISAQSSVGRVTAKTSFNDLSDSSYPYPRVLEYKIELYGFPSDAYTSIYIQNKGGTTNTLVIDVDPKDPQQPILYIFGQEPKISIIDKGRWWDDGKTYRGLHLRVDDTVGIESIIIESKHVSGNAAIFTWTSFSEPPYPRVFEHQIRLDEFTGQINTTFRAQSNNDMIAAVSYSGYDPVIETFAKEHNISPQLATVIYNGVKAVEGGSWDARWFGAIEVTLSVDQCKLLALLLDFSLESEGVLALIFIAAAASTGGGALAALPIILIIMALIALNVGEIDLFLHDSINKNIPGKLGYFVPLGILYSSN